MFRVRLAVLVATVFMMSAPSADARVVITIDKSAQAMTVVVDGERRWTWPVSTGRRGYATPTGKYAAFRMEEEHYSKEWDDAPMPHSIFFTKRGHAIHGTTEARRLGTAASHGCVRLAPENAAKLFALVKEQGVTNATVVVSDGDGQAVARAAPKRPAAPRYEQAEPVYESAPYAYRRPFQQQAPGYYQPAPRNYDPRYEAQPRYETQQPFRGGGLFRW